MVENHDQSCCKEFNTIQSCINLMAADSKWILPG